MIKLYSGIYDLDSIQNELQKLEGKYIQIFVQVSECHAPAAAPELVRIEIEKTLRSQIQSLRREYNKNNRKNQLSTAQYLQLIFDLAKLWGEEHQHTLKK